MNSYFVRKVSGSYLCQSPFVSFLVLVGGRLSLTSRGFGFSSSIASCSCIGSLDEVAAFCVITAARLSRMARFALTLALPFDLMANFWNRACFILDALEHLVDPLPFIGRVLACRYERYIHYVLKMAVRWSWDSTGPVDVVCLFGLRSKKWLKDNVKETKKWCIQPIRLGTKQE